MMLAAFFFLFLLTDGNASTYSEQPELLDGQQNFSLSFEEGGNASTYSEQPELLDDQQNFSLSFEEDGSATPYLEPPVLDDSYYESSKCSHEDILNHLNLTEKAGLYTMVRPVEDHRRFTWVEIQMVIYAILDVREIDQTFLSYIWVYVVWHNEYIWWNPSNFCGLERIVVPSEVLWKPDLLIEEMIKVEKDRIPQTPSIVISNDGFIHLRNNLVLVTTCKMEVYKFPFDIQNCSISFKSAVYSDEEIFLREYANSSKTKEWSRKVMRTQSEWLFEDVKVNHKTVSYLDYNQSVIVYSISMRRRSALYIANFMLPILFFLCLDLASFLISDSGGEKLGFKVTVLLAVTVMQLILNEILPSSSDRIPLIAVYCIGSFGLMLLSLLETILVMHLLEKDSQDNEPLEDQGLNEKKWTDLACVCDVSAEETPPEKLSVAKEGSSSHLMEEAHSLEKVSDELREVERTLSLILSSRKEDRKPVYWSRVVKTINRIFVIFYVTVATLFLAVVFSLWHQDSEDSSGAKALKHDGVTATI